jgi:hypothetical protein
MLGPDRVPPPTRVELHASQTDSTWTIAIGLDAGDVRVDRQLRGDDCDVLTEAVALVIAVQVDPVAVAAVVAPAVAPDDAGGSVPPPEITASERVAEPPPPVEQARPSTRPPPPPRLRAPPRAVLGAIVGGEIGVLPRSGAVFELDVGVTWRHARLELAGLASVGPDAQPVSGVAGRFRLFAAAARGCGVVVRDAIEFPVCGAFEVGQLWARGTGLTDPDTVQALWIAPVIGIRPRWIPTRRLALGAMIDVVIPILHHRFSSADGGFAYEVAPVAGRLGLGAEVRLP